MINLLLISLFFLYLCSLPLCSISQSIVMLIFKKPVARLLFFSFLASFFYHCKNSASLVEEQSAPSFLAEEYYMQYKSLETRAAQLMCGRFSCYKGFSKELFRVNDNQDSIVVYTVTIGDPNRDGTWIYKEAFMSNFPEKPLTQLFQKIEKNSPDSLTLYEYRPKSKQNEYIGFYKKDKKERLFSQKDLVSTGCVAGITKTNQTTFECNASLCERNTGQKTKWLDVQVVHSPSGSMLKTITYKLPDRSKENKLSGSYLFYRRLAVVD